MHSKQSKIVTTINFSKYKNLLGQAWLKQVTVARRKKTLGWKN
jgi:hypothetical protein